MARALTGTLPSMGFCDGCGKWRPLRNLSIWVQRIARLVKTARCAECMPGQQAPDPQADKAARLRAGAQQIVQADSKGQFARPDAREENGSVYCGRPRLASAKHAKMREAAYGEKSKFDSYNTWRG